MLDQTLLMQTLQDIANTGERLSNPSEENAFIVIAEAFKNVGAEVNIERVPLFVSTVDNVRMTADGQRIKALGNAMTLPLDGNNPRQGTVSHYLLMETIPDKERFLFKGICVFFLPRIGKAMKRRAILTRLFFLTVWPI